ncbi:MAG: DUF2851 family protein [Dehalococcoidia bacterium]
MATRNRIAFPEKQAVLLWQQMVGQELTSSQHGPLSVIYPGRANDDSGPDFRDAVIESASGVTKGDVEVHVNSGDWYSHAHHTDAGYNNVILHVVMWHDCNSTTLLQSGNSIPVLCLAEALHQQAYLLPYRLPCFHILNRVDKQALAEYLGMAGEERFKQKAIAFETRLRREGAGQVLFSGIMRALGYAKNTQSFEELAGRMPLKALESAEGLDLKKALLLGTAGLLPSQRWQEERPNDGEALKLERIWRSEGRQRETMTADNWNLTHIYPNNSPVRRIMAQGHLLKRYREEGLLAGMMRLVMQAPLTNGSRVLDDGLAVVNDGYWADHFDFGTTGKTRASALLGKSKAGEIIANVILPFAFCWGRSVDSPALADKARELYHNRPGLPGNCITRHMARQFGLEQPSGLTACHQQGLLHIFRCHCREGRCSLCPIIRGARLRPPQLFPAASRC